MPLVGGRGLVPRPLAQGVTLHPSVRALPLRPAGVPRLVLPGIKESLAAGQRFYETRPAALC